MNNQYDIISEITKNIELDYKESEQGYIEAISGPVVIGKNMAGVSMYELVKVGTINLIGEVIKIENDKATIQIYEDTTGLEVNDVILRMKQPLSVELGPGLFENIYDGIQRPLKIIKETYDSIFIPRGIEMECLDRKKEYFFDPIGK